jgi:chorismate lyase / 3-hydroxybenzoate synthase
VRPSQTQRSYAAGRHTPEATVRPRLTYVETTKLTAWLATSGTHPLAIISFGQAIPRTISCPTIRLDLPQLEGHPLLEVWTSDQPVTTLQKNECSLAMSGDVLAGAISLDEKAGATLDVTTELAYRQLLHHTRELGFPYLWRVWNFFPDINEEEAGLERYRRFCVGRHQALEASLQDFPSALPAGTAVGTRSGPLQTYFLAGAHPATHLGNPRQMNAYEYPKDYGPQSPAFARATLCGSESGPQLFIAGTASVVGHTSRHADRPKEQTQEMVHNLRTLIAYADSMEPKGIRTSHRAIYKVYVRNPDQLISVRQALRDPLLSSSQILLLQGDLCRRELLVEIEGLVTSD